MKIENSIGICAALLILITMGVFSAAADEGVVVASEDIDSKIVALSAFVDDPLWEMGEIAYRENYKYSNAIRYNAQGEEAEDLLYDIWRENLNHTTQRVKRMNVTGFKDKAKRELLTYLLLMTRYTYEAQRGSDEASDTYSNANRCWTGFFKQYNRHYCPPSRERRYVPELVSLVSGSNND